MCTRDKQATQSGGGLGGGREREGKAMSFDLVSWEEEERGGGKKEKEYVALLGDSLLVSKKNLHQNGGGGNTILQPRFCVLD